MKKIKKVLFFLSVRTPISSIIITFVFFAAFLTIASNYMVNHMVNVPSNIIEYDYDRKQATVQFDTGAVSEEEESKLNLEIGSKVYFLYSKQAPYICGEIVDYNESEYVIRFDYPVESNKVNWDEASFQVVDGKESILGRLVKR